MKTKTLFSTFRYGVLAAIGSLAMSTTHADDLEVFINPGLDTVVPNLIFVLDLSNSMNQTPTGGVASMGNPARLDILTQAVGQILSDPNLPEINVGFTYFRDYEGSGIKFPASKFDSDANTIDPNIPAGTEVREVIEFMVNAANASQETPTVDALYEVARYLRGEVPLYGLRDNFGTWNTGSNQYTGGSGGMPDGWRAANPASYSGSNGYVALGTGTPGTCDDWSASVPPSSNNCASQQAAAAPMSCVPTAWAGRTCTATTCDASCGTTTTCPGGYIATTTPRVWDPTPPAACINDSSGNIWVTSTSDGNPTRCCSAADAGLSECIATANYSSSGGNTTYTCPVATTTECRFSNDSPARTFQRCTFNRRDDRIYTSPITEQCQKTAVVLLTDGDPSANRVDQGTTSGATATSPYLVRDMIASADPMITRNDVICDDYSTAFGKVAGTHRYANCAKELAKFLHDEDQIPTLEGSTIDTYAIGFGLVGPAAAGTWSYLNDVADAGGGEAFEATDLASLVDAFQNVIANVTGRNQRFSGFATSFDGTTLQSGSKAYLTLFDPTNQRTWDGNVKGYYVDGGVIKDVTGTPATEINAATGKVAFKASSQSFWSAGADGNSPLAGGFLGNLNAATRNLYVTTNPADTTNVNLTDGNHDLDTGNANLTAAAMGMPAASTAADISDMITWIRSERMGDPLHTQPQAVLYSAAIGEVVYVTTNQGFLHAINANAPTAVNDTSGGDEIFAFMPHQMLATVQAQRAGNVAGPHIYGLDGPMTVALEDVDGNGRIDGASDKAFLYFGMRRGGNTYFAVDVTDPYAPRLVWQISDATPGFQFLGETWSRMTPATVNDSGTPRRVLIFGGGYDSATQDVPNTGRNPAGDNSGMGIYIVDAQSGALLNSIGADNAITPGQDFVVDMPDMKYGIPADIRAEDTDVNGFVNRLYASDVGGQIWRVDIAEGSSITAAGTLSAYKVADLGGVAVVDNRRFYYPPSVAHAVRDGTMVTSLAIGSGYRAHPLNSAANDKFFVIFDENFAPGAPAMAVTALTTADFYDATSNLIQTTTGATQTAELTALSAKKGWFIDLGSDQKVLARARTFRNTVFFTAFETGTPNVCDFTGGSNRFFAVNLINAIGEIDLDTDYDGVPDTISRDMVANDEAAILGEPGFLTHVEPGASPTPDPFCTTVLAGSQAVMKICDSPVRVNWQSLQ